MSTPPPDHAASSPPPAGRGEPTNESLTNPARDRQDGMLARLSHSLFGDPSGRLARFADEQRLERLDGCGKMEGPMDDCLRVREAMLASASSSSSSASSPPPPPSSSWFGRNSTTSDRDGGDGENTTIATYTPQTAEQSSGSTLKIARFYGWGVGGSGANRAERAEEERTMGQHDTTKELQAVHTSPPDQAAAATVSISFGTEKSAGSTAGSIGEDGSVATGAAAVPSCSRESHAVWACRALALGCADHLVPLRKCLKETGTEAVHYYEDKGTATERDFSEEATAKEECALEQRALTKCVGLNLAELERRIKSREGGA